MKSPAIVLFVFVAVFATTASADEVQYTTTLSGANENPANSSTGIGSARVTVDLDTVTMRVEATFSDLIGDVTAAHIHCCTAPPGNVGVATPTPTFPGFPAGVKSGAYDMTFDMSLDSSYNASFVAGNGGTVSDALNALVAGLDSGSAYLNIHTTNVGSGEIRGFLQAVPEPSCGVLMLMGMACFAGFRRRRPRSLV